jgi:HK97 family phage major capsid protein
MNPKIEELKTILRDLQKATIEEAKRMVKDEMGPLERQMEAILSLPAKPVTLPSPLALPTYEREEEEHYKFQRNIGNRATKVGQYLQDLYFAKRDRNPEAIQRIARLHAERKAALQEDTGSEGGYLVPTELENEIIYISKQAGLEKFCRTLGMQHKTKTVPALDNWPSVAWHSEEASITETEPTFAEISLTAKRLDAYATISNELLEDAAPDVVGFLVEIFGQAVAQEIDNQILNGTGTPCSGVLTAAAGYSVVLGAGKTSFSSVSGDDLSQMISKIESGARNGARFVFHKTISHYLRVMKDGSNRYVNVASPAQMPTVGMGMNFWGYPFEESDSAPSTSAANTPFGVFGNFYYFLLGNRSGIKIDLDPYGLFTTNQTRVRIIRRVALAVGRPNAFCRLLTAAS